MTLATMPRPETRTRDAAAVMMKAFVYRGPGEKALEERPKPEITAATDAIVKIVKTTICGTDLHILKGDVPTCQPGRILGHEGVGIVDKVGPAVTVFKPGDRVAFLSLNCHRLLEAYFGVLEARAVLLPLNIRLAAPELAYILNDSGATVLFIEQEFVGLVDSFRRDLRTVRSFHLLDFQQNDSRQNDGPPPEWLSDQTYEQRLASATPCRGELTAFDENSVAELFYTSGTSASQRV